MLSLRANQLPKVTLIDFNGIHPWREHKVIEHVVMLTWRLMAQAESVPEVFRLSKYSEETLEEADLFYETLRRYQCGQNSTFAELKMVVERFSGGLKNVLRDGQEEVKWGAVLEQLLIAAETVDKAVEDGGLEVSVGWWELSVLAAVDSAFSVRIDDTPFSSMCLQCMITTRRTAS
jgi:hypothetical protein